MNNQEYLKCKNSPYYFAIKYLCIKTDNGEFKKFTTRLTEKEFNNFFKKCL